MFLALPRLAALLKYAEKPPPADRVLYEAAEDRAMAKRLGLWSQPAPVPPWEWRGR